MTRRFRGISGEVGTMSKIIMLFTVGLSAAVTSTIMGGCSSSLTTLSPKMPVKYEKLGPVKGEATGSLGIFSPTTYFIPMGLNDRAVLAYQDALSKAPGATALAEVTYQESWFWWLIGTGRTVTISGEAIKEVSE